MGKGGSTVSYQLEIKQLLKFRHCRIYRKYIRNLMRDMNLKTKGSSYLFFYVILCSYANFRTSYTRIESNYFTVYPGHWVCKVNEVTEWFRLKSRKQTFAVLDTLTEAGLITYKMYHNDKIINFKIRGWKASNVVLEYNAPCQKDEGFFFFPIANALKLVDGSKCSEADMLMDIWLNTILNDLEVKGSHLGPIAYFRGIRDSAMISNSELAKRWGISRTTVFRVLKKFEEMNFIDVIHFTGTSGSVIYTKNYMETMFEVEDMYIDRGEVVAVFETVERIQPEVVEETIVFTEEDFSAEINGGSKEEFTGAKLIVKRMVSKVREQLINKGFSELQSKSAIYKLSSLSLDCKGDIKSYMLDIGIKKKELHFEVCVRAREDG